MAVTNYAIAICLLAATFIPVHLATSTTAEPSTTEEVATTDASTAAGQSTAAVTTATTVARNISCHVYSCEEGGCIKAAISNVSITTGICYTAGNCFVKRTTNSTYTKEEVGCESSSCSTTIHDNGDGKRICCTTSDCNKDTTAFNTQSNAPSLSFTIAIIFSFFTLCLNIFWNLELIWYTPSPLFLSKPFHVSQSFVLKLYLLRIFKQFLKTNIALLSWHK